MAESYDVFVSYARADSARVKPLVSSLRARGLRVWFDETEIADFASITRGISEGLANATALIACYSDAYPTRQACQWELTTAFIAAQHEGDPRRRVCVINLEDHAYHIHPVELRDALFRNLPQNADKTMLADIVEAVHAAVQALPGPLSDVLPLAAPPWYGGRGLGSNRFVGRIQSLWDLHSKLHANNVAVITGQAAPGHAQVRGMGGIGKSLLAEEYALRFRAAFPGGIFVLKATSNRDDQIAQFATAMGISTTGVEAAEIAGALERHLRAAEASYLWLVDDLPGGLPENEHRAWFAPNDFGKTVITTRSRECSSTGGVIDLGVLEPGESYRLLTAHRKPADEQEEAAARELVGELGHHALAVDVAGGALAALSGFDSIAGFLAQIRASANNALAVAAQLCSDLPNGHEPSIASTLLRSIDLLDEPSRDFLRLASLLASDLIPDDLVDKVLPSSSPWGAVLLVKPVLAHSLAERGSSAGDGVSGCFVHVLVRRIMEFYDKSDARREELRARAISALHEVLSAKAGIRANQALRAHLAHARHLVASPNTRAEASLLRRVAWCEYQRASYVAAQTHQDLVLATMRRLLGDEHSDTLDAQNELALTLCAVGDFAGAREHQEAVLAATQRLLGDEHPDTLAARNNLALTLSALGDLAGARKHQEAVLAATQRLLGDEHPDTLKARSNLASMLYDQGDLAGAQKHQNAVLTRRLLLGDQHPDVLTIRNNLALTLSALGDLAGARKHQEAVLAATQRLLGDEHPDTLKARSNLAVTLAKLGSLANSREHQEAVLAATQRLLGDEHPTTLTARNNLATSLYDQENFASARVHQEAVLAATQRLLGDEHPDTLTARNNLAMTLSALGDLAGARKHQEAVLAATQRLLGDEHPTTIAARHNLALTLYTQRDLEHACEHQEAVLAATQRLLGDEHPDTLKARKDLDLMLKMKLFVQLSHLPAFRVFCLGLAAASSLATAALVSWLVPAKSSWIKLSLGVATISIVFWWLSHGILKRMGPHQVSNRGAGSRMGP